MVPGVRVRRCARAGGPQPPQLGLSTCSPSCRAAATTATARPCGRTRPVAVAPGHSRDPQDIHRRRRSRSQSRTSRRWCGRPSPACTTLGSAAGEAEAAGVTMPPPPGGRAVRLRALTACSSAGPVAAKLTTTPPASSRLATARPAMRGHRASRRRDGNDADAGRSRSGDPDHDQVAGQGQRRRRGQLRASTGTGRRAVTGCSRTPPPARPRSAVTAAPTATSPASIELIGARAGRAVQPTALRLLLAGRSRCWPPAARPPSRQPRARPGTSTCCPSCRGAATSATARPWAPDSGQAPPISDDPPGRL